MSDITHLHTWHHDDYEVAKKEILTQIGSLDDMELFGRRVLVAVYVRPSRSAKGLYSTVRMQKEDIYQGKAVLLVKCGPDAFIGEDSFIAAEYGPQGAPKVGEWLFLESNEGTPVNWQGDGAINLEFEDDEGRKQKRFDWNGWPCRVVMDTGFMGRMGTPHSAV